MTSQGDEGTRIRAKNADGGVRIDQI